MKNIKSYRKIDDTIIESLVMNDKVILFDTETTGLTNDSQIIEFAGTRYHINEDFSLTKEETCHKYIKPYEPISEKITEITGITNEFLEDYPTEDYVVDEILNFFDTANVIVAHNIKFDMRMLNGLTERTKCKSIDKIMIDNLKLSRDLIPKEEIDNYKLKTVTEYLYPDTDIKYHAADADIYAMKLCFEKLIKKLACYEDQMKQKRQVYLQWATLTINPYKKSMVRIGLMLSEGDKYDIFWDVIKKCWCCKSTAKSKKLFNEIDIDNIESQLLRRYGYRFNAHDMETLAYNWHKSKKEKERKERKED